ncbi:STAS domain-containing protein [Streptomyces sp. NPDC059009]|uniref:STAS domain-containing protein n=1 Tax=Streptomyces sp. NPDC059009 TaxID=3346694 RepID=UPI0036C86EEA
MDELSLRGHVILMDVEPRGGQRLLLRRVPAGPCHSMTLYVTGELDSASVPVLCELVSVVLAEGSRHVTLVLHGVTQCDNASFYVLLGVRQALHHAGGSLSLSRPSTEVRLAFERSLLRQVFPLHDELGPAA